MMRRLAGLATSLLVALLALGCGSSGNPTVAQYYGNYHVKGWINDHAGQAVIGVDACRRCHELSILRVGSGVPTCMTTGCHHATTPVWATPTDPGIHGTRAKMAADPNTGGSLASCQICHGSDFAGGASARTCFTCHGVNAPHPPLPWNGGTLTHATTDPSNAGACAQCHYFGSPHNPAGFPSSAPAPGLQPGCYNATLCHGQNPAPHPVPFLAGQTDGSHNGHMTATAAQFASDCASCHAYSGAAPNANAPLCGVCHTKADPTLAGSDIGTCLSCHDGGAPGSANPFAQFGPTGTAFPSVAGAHAKHLGLPTALTCSTCHAGSESGSRVHYDLASKRLPNPPTAGPAPVTIDATFKGKPAGNPGFVPSGSGGGCSNVSCHGGQTTPDWLSAGSINAATDCTTCHAVAASAGTITQFNDAFGRHSQGTHDATNSANGIACTTCHAMSNGKPGALAHFKYLNTPAVSGVATGTPADQLPSDTIVFNPAIVTGPGTYTVTSATQDNGGCALTCHTHLHVATINTWQASGAPHSVPFAAGQVDTAGNGHMTADATAFSNDCGICHAYTGTSPNAAAPLCQSCHALHDPVQAAYGPGKCTSCHVGADGLPNGPEGTTFPNIAGAHAKHMALVGKNPTLTCDACHAGTGTGTGAHYANAKAGGPNPAPVSLSATYKSQSGGTAGFTPAALTCSNVSCHGGQVTPNWRTGTIATLSQCSLCHAINGGSTPPQFNDAVDQHNGSTHKTAATSASAGCALCHDMSAANTASGAVNHFASLNTPASYPSPSKPASGTIVFSTNNGAYQITGPPTYSTAPPNKEGDGGCALTCHGVASGVTQTHDAVNFHWQGSGMAHAKPFISTAPSTAGHYHHQVTAATFSSDCNACHDITGATTKSGPTCMTCHTLADPTQPATGAGTCLSCHVGANFGIQGPGGSAWPSLAGAHAKHTGLLTFNRGGSPALPASLTASAFPVCEACHAGSAPYDGPQTHYADANKRVSTPNATPSVAIDATFNAMSGTAGNTPSTTAWTCSNVSCHGGQVTPGWQTGKITVNATTYCTACHKYAGTQTQYNDATGRHNSVGEHRQTCDYCHDMTQTTLGSQNHFKYLDTTVVSGVSGTPPDQYPSDTIKFNTTNVTLTTPGQKNYFVTSPGAQGRGYCTITCHVGNENHDSGRTWN